jgi:pyruvate formate lyase activating enzyme
MSPVRRDIPGGDVVTEMLGKAKFWEPAEQGKVRCGLCPHSCLVPAGKTGICRVRENRGGTLYALNYNLATSLALDPVEKKPLYHVHPGGYLLSAGTFGCNFRCRFCQNWQISQDRPRTVAITAGELVESALAQRKRYPALVGMAYTYNEPTVWIEFVLEAAARAKEEGLVNALVTNGYISRPALREVLQFVDALNIDVKAWNEDFYRRLTGGRLKPVLETVEESLKHAWVEVTYLVIPGENDSQEEVAALARHLASLSPSVPVHLSRFFPNYRMGGEPTPLETLERLRDVCREHLHHVYIGNAARPGYADTPCPECGTTLLKRDGLALERAFLTPDGDCPECGRPLEMLGQVWL